MGPSMKIEDVRRTAYSMPLTNPAFPPGPYRFFNREYFIITYRTDPEALAAVVPEPLEVVEPVVKEIVPVGVPVPEVGVTMTW